MVAVGGLGQNQNGTGTGSQRRNAASKNEQFDAGNSAEVVLQTIQARNTHLGSLGRLGWDRRPRVQSRCGDAGTLGVEGDTCSALVSMETGWNVENATSPAWTATGFGAGRVGLEGGRAGNEIRQRWKGAKWKTTLCKFDKPEVGRANRRERDQVRGESGGHVLACACSWTGEQESGGALQRRPLSRRAPKYTHDIPKLHLGSPESRERNQPRRRSDEGGNVNGLNAND